MFTKNRLLRKTRRRISAACLIFAVLSFVPYVVTVQNISIITGNGRTFDSLKADVCPDDLTYTGMITKAETPKKTMRRAGGFRSSSYAVSKIEEISENMDIRAAWDSETAPTSEAAIIESGTVSGNSESPELSIYGQSPPEDGGGYITIASGETLAYTKILYCSATAYTTERQENKITATGTTARVGAIAVDPTVIPYGSKMYILSENDEWVYGYAVAEDCGGGIKGNRIDLFFDTYDECMTFGVRNAIVYILDQ
ncbi:MAG: hypothetical protein GX111_00750 [Clostridiales bacterium]|nr:hypothetical protein [Clostridiales bacterium]